MTNDNLIEKLRIVLADTYALYLKTQSYHWHVTGSNFKSLHELFEEQYNDLADAIDEIAERIIILGSDVPATFKEYIELTNIQDADNNLDSDRMVTDLTESQKVLAKSIKEALEQAQELGDEVSTDLMIGRLAVHEKNEWFLRSSA